MEELTILGGHPEKSDRIQGLLAVADTWCGEHDLGESRLRQIADQRLRYYFQMEVAAACLERNGKNRCEAALRRIAKPVLATADPFLLGRLEQIYLKAGLLDETLETLSTKGSGWWEPHRAFALPELAAAYVKTGDLSRARQALQLASRIGEGMPEEQYNQASCMKGVAAGYIGIGDHDEAVRLIKRALDLPAVAKDARFRILTIPAFIESYRTSQVSPPQDKLEAIREVLMDGHL